MKLHSRNRHLLLALIVLVALLVAGCSTAETPTSAPATSEPLSPTEEPTAPPTPTDEPTAAPTDTEEPTPEPTEVPTDTPIPEPTNTPQPREEVYLVWAPGGVKPSDSDDVDGIVEDISGVDGIIGGNGNEIGINVVYNPTIITVEEIIELLRSIGHPVMLDE